MFLRRFRHTPLGPERVLEQVVVKSIPEFHENCGKDTWVAGSLQVGAGIPDILVATWMPAVRALANVGEQSSDILAYLRVVHRARAKTIAERLRRPDRSVRPHVEQLTEAGILKADSGNYSLDEEWRHILPELVSVEVKVSNWRVAVSQALRNRIFCHKSFVALPERPAEVARHDPYIKKAGIGVLAVNLKTGVKVIKKARQNKPRAWKYYYQIASILAANIENETWSVRR